MEPPASDLDPHQVQFPITGWSVQTKECRGLHLIRDLEASERRQIWRDTEALLFLSSRTSRKADCWTEELGFE